MVYTYKYIYFHNILHMYFSHKICQKSYTLLIGNNNKTTTQLSLQIPIKRIVGLFFSEIQHCK